MTDTQIIAKEGYKGIAIIFILLVIFSWLGWGFFIFLSILFLVLWIFAFRNPERLPQDRFNPVMVAPIDGEITQIESNDEFVYVSIDVDWLDAGILRAPLEIDSYSVAKKNGLFLRFAKQELKDTLNTRILLTSKEKYPFELELFPELFTKSSIYGKSKFVANDRIGFMKLGHLCLKFPAKLLDLKANVGDKIKGGQTIIGYIK